jgi:hypothetical protein
MVFSVAALTAVAPADLAGSPISLSVDRPSKVFHNSVHNENDDLGYSSRQNGDSLG